LPEPTLIHLSGQTCRASVCLCIVATVMKPRGLMAIQLLLKKYKDKQLARSLSIFFGNVTAASHNLRRLDNQPDYNRIWPGKESPDCAETEMAKEIVAHHEKAQRFCQVWTVHNNTGLNPHYACINNLDNQFSTVGVFIRPADSLFHPSKGGTIRRICANMSGSLRLECGRPDQATWTGACAGILTSCLRLQ